MSQWARLVGDARSWRTAVPARAPAYHALLEQLEVVLDDGAIAARFEEAWAGRKFRVFYERPLLFIAALRFAALKTGVGHSLRAAIGEPPDPEAVNAEAIRAALADEEVWASLRERYVQTNETSRAVAWLWPALLAGCGRGARPLALVEVGCAAGLNLVADGLGQSWSHVGRGTLAVVERPAVVARLGLDRRPLDVMNDDAVLWMRACIWAGEQERLERFDAAVAAFRANPVPLEACDATEAPARLERVSAETPAGGLVLVFQTIVRDYFDPATAEAYARGMRAWLAAQPRGRAVWVELELAPDNSDPARLAGIYAHVGGADLLLGRTSYHPVDVAVDDAAVARFVELIV